ncbi:uncharacterized protein VICG_02006 [Vittaforma corneae ATCC 50505]|uniref:Uncharacterized protein n=1 Tax=Vittaforma corneae (strain ATCC 50505) TaxID=993615 RepID=L2GJD5_VITCO|nr:uncharacterized protein VICG_02006 [Vittaforma corneae ATCC 50505]ELA40976.1 hypothetical protein VICG_02006 [Vittaforma corneae ATCC 50505]
MNENDCADSQRKKAKVSLIFKQKVMETPITEENDESFYDDGRVCYLRRELLECEEYFLKKIEFYLTEFEEEKTKFTSLVSDLERELEDSRMAQLELLVKIKNLKNRIVELEGKTQFYKNKVQKYEGSQNITNNS